MLLEDVIKRYRILETVDEENLPQDEIGVHLTELMAVTELTTNYPDVPIFKDINVKELTAGDPNPVFVTLPIGQANVTSGNNRYYDEDFLQEMERQVSSKKPIGLMGHLSKDRRATEFPPEAVHWIGARRVGDILLGKGYLPGGDARVRLQRYRATNKPIATSIDAFVDLKWDPALKAHRAIASTLDLGQIDLAPADRAGVGSLAAVPVLTQEMVNQRASSSGIVIPKEKKMEKDEVLNSLTPADISSLPEAVRKEMSSQLVQEMRVQLGLPEDADVISVMKQLRAAGETGTEITINSRITELLDSEDKGIKVKSVRNFVKSLVMASKPGSVQEAEQIYDTVVAGEDVKEALQEFVSTKMGPSQRTPIQSQSGKKRDNKLFLIPSKEDEEDE